MADRIQLNVNRFAIKSRFMYGLAGSEEVNFLEDRLQNCVVLENDRFESRLGAGERTFSGRADGTAVAGQFTQIGLWIPAGSGMLVTIEKMRLFVPAAAYNVRRLFSSAAFASAGSAIGCDTRMGSSTVPAAQLVQTANAAEVGTVIDFAAAANEIIDSPFTMAPSDTAGVLFLVSQSVVNQANSAIIRWRERPLENGLLS